MSTETSGIFTAVKPADIGRAPSAPGPLNENVFSEAQTDLQKKSEIRYDPAEMRRNLEDAIARINEQMKRKAQNLSFSFDQVAERTVITVKNTESGEVIRQIPDVALLRVAHNIEELKGMLYNESI